MDKRDRVVCILAEYIEVYPGTKISAKGLAKYADNLSEFSEEDVRKAMEALLRQCKFFPTIAAIYDAIMGFKGKYTPENGFI